ncbi:hypothetical protein [Agromyces tropicus]|uniref:hypothetical protein n=1 Tax=Agromyces tropicus TaxID=555371 RepID=UPI0031D6C7AB
MAAELDRELESVAGRQANAVTRASIVLAAAGVTAFSVASSSLGWSLIPAFLSLVSAFLSLAGIRYWKSRAVQLKRAHVKAYLEASPYDAQWRLVADKFDELGAARADLERKTNYLEGAVGMLVLAWTSAVVVRFVVEPVLTGAGY